MRAVPQLAVDFIKGAEACKLVIYADSAGRPTGGVGHLLEPGDGYKIRDTITQVTADRWLGLDLARAVSELYGALPDASITALSDHQWSALISFAFNVGANSSWTIWSVIKAGNLAQVPAQLMRFDRALIHGVEQEVPGLLNRRMAECSLWKTPDAAAAIAIIQAAPIAPPPSSETRTAATPPVSTAAAPLSQSKQLIAGAITTGASVAAVAASGAQQIIGVVSPLAQFSHVLGSVLGPLAVVAAIAGGAVIVFRVMDQKRQVN